ncbi:MAG TPA: hypothetical protein VGS05_17380 [Candidatus Sulfotelmatobacter sp.]|nr:hypothetical protein [Candidatus Sulfotelmatobacter sp.]
MSKVSTWRKAGVVARIAGQQAGRSRAFNAFKSATRATARSFGRVLHQLWLEVTGVLFLVMALSLAGAAVKEYERYHAGQVGPGRAAAAACFAVAFTWFGVSSFWRVKRKSQRS